jgi:hypothetical protein
MTTPSIQPLSIDTIPPDTPDVTTDVFSQEEQALLYFTAPTCTMKPWTSCVVQL